MLCPSGRVHELDRDQREPGFTMSPITAQSSLVGKLLGEKYRIEQQIGQGGFGVVYRATHLGLGKLRAVKVLRQISEDRRKRLDLEARALAELDHPYIVAVVDVGMTDDANPYLVMEYVEGPSLGEIITAEGKLSLRRTLAIMKCVCSAVHYAHERGIIHRDLKPSNIIVQRFSGEGEMAKVLDFGLAKFLQQYASERVSGPTTESGLILGTVEYLSPEQCSGQPIDARSDVYALGVIAYQMLTGALPFKGDTPLAILTQHISASPPRLRDVCPELPASVEQVVRRAMAKDPAQRQQTALELRDELERAVSNPDQSLIQETEEISATLRLPSREVFGSWPRRLFNAKAIMAVVAVLVVAFSAWHFYPRREAAPEPWVLSETVGFQEPFALTEDNRPNPNYWDTPQPWKIVPSDQEGGEGAMVVQGPQLGVFLNPESPKMLYDFEATFMASVERGRRIVWVLRAQNATDYYLFELTFPEDEQKGAQCRGYVYNSEFDQRHPFPFTQPISDFGPVQRGDVYQVDVKAVGHKFIHQFRRSNEGRFDRFTGPWEVTLEPEPEDRLYQYGTIGFGELEPDEALKIEDVKIIRATGPQPQE